MILGGFGVEGTTDAGDVGNDHWRYRNGWTRLESGASPPARYPSLCSTADALWRFGGCGYRDGAMRFLDELWRFDGAWRRVEAKGNGPAGRYTSAFTSWDGALLVFGGHSQDGEGRKSYHGDLWCFADGAWSRIHGEETGPGSRYGFGWAAHGHQLFVFGGFDGEADRDDFWVLDLISLSWQRLPGMPPERYCPALGVVEGAVILFGGRSKTDPRRNLADTWIYTGNDWEKIGDGLPGYHAKPGYASDGECLWMFAGEGPAGHLSDLWRYDTDGWKLIDPGRDDDPVLW